MLDGRHTMRRSARRASHEDSENECDGRLSLGTAGVSPPDYPPAKMPENARSPLTANYNGGDHAKPAVPSKLPQAGTPSKAKPPTAPGMSRFGFKPPAAGSLSPRRPACGGVSERTTLQRTNSQETSAVTRAAVASLLSPSRTRGPGSGTRENIRSRPADVARPEVRTTRARAATAAANRAAVGAGVRGSAQQGPSVRSNASSRSRKPATAPAGTGRVNPRAAFGTAASSSRRLSVSEDIYTEYNFSLWQ